MIHVNGLKYSPLYTKLLITQVLESAESELEKVPSSASVLVRKDFGIRENLRKAQGGKKLKVLQF